MKYFVRFFIYCKGRQHNSLVKRKLKYNISNKIKCVVFLLICEIKQTNNYLSHFIYLRDIFSLWKKCGRESYKNGPALRAAAHGACVSLVKALQVTTRTCYRDVLVLAAEIQVIDFRDPDTRRYPTIVAKPCETNMELDKKRFTIDECHLSLAKRSFSGNVI